MSLRQEGCLDCAHSTSGDCGRHRLPVATMVVPPLPQADAVLAALTCPAHPGELATGACAACLREAVARAEKAEAERVALDATLAHLRGELAGDREARRLYARQCDLTREAQAERDAARQTAEDYVRGLAAQRDEALRRLAEVGAERDWMRDAACGEAVSDFAESFAGVRAVADLRAERDAARRDGAVWEQEAERYQHQRDAARRELEELVARLCDQERDLGDARHERDAARREAAEAKAHHMDAPGGPRCACGLPAAHESGACRRCVALSEAQAREAKLREALRDFAVAGTRHDPTPTQSHKWGVSEWYEWTAGMDASVRRRATAALAVPADRAALDDK